MANFPTSLDTLTNPWAWDYQDTTPHSTQHATANDILEALEVSVWITWSADTSSLRYMQERLTTKWDILVHNGTNYVRLPVWTNGYQLVADSSEATWLKYIATTSWGTVTSVSVASANWFGGSVATATTTPAITITTSITGLLKGNGTAISAAVAWTDYYAPSGTDVSVSDGGTWVSSLTAYAPIFWGTTWTWAVQSWTVWNAWEVLTSNGAWALPTFQSLGIKKRTSAVNTMVNPSTVGVINTTNYGTTVTFEGWLIYGYINWAVQWVDCTGEIWVQYSPDNSTWTTILSTSWFAYFGNSFSDAVDSPVEACICPPWYIRVYASTSGTSVTGWTTLWTTYFRY